MDQSQLDQLRMEVEAAQLQNQLEHLRPTGLPSENHGHFVGSANGGVVMLEGWGDLVDRRDFLTDGHGASYFGHRLGDWDAYQIARPEDRQNGDYFPFWQTEQEHREIVGVARVLAGASEVAIGALDNLVNYTVDQGFGYTFTPKDEEGKRWATICQEIVDRMMVNNKWEADGEREGFIRTRRDGERFVSLSHRGGLEVELRFEDTTTITEPDNIRGLEDYLVETGLLPDAYGLDWKYGVVTPPGNSQRVLGYFVERPGNLGEDWQFHTPATMVHVRANVDREVKRGMPDLFSVSSNLGRGEKLLGNTLEGSAVQAAIAFIRKHAQGTASDAIRDYVAGQADRTISETTKGGRTRTRNIRKYHPGTIHDIPNGMDYVAGPLGSSNGPRFIEVVQAALRIVGVRWKQAEYMISGDASNGNFSSTLVAEAPFTKSTVALQGTEVRAAREMCWKAVAMVQIATRCFGQEVDLATIQAHVQLTVDAPEVAIRNRLEDHQIRRDEHQAGVLSLSTWADEAGRDLEEEIRKGATPQPATPAPGPVPVPESWERWRGYP